jgi:hypothetical protein
MKNSVVNTVQGAYLNSGVTHRVLHSTLSRKYQTRVKVADSYEPVVLITAVKSFVVQASSFVCRL